MESVIYDQTPLADYLRNEGEDDQSDWAAPDRDLDDSSSLPSSPIFAPTGRPKVRSRFRSKIPDPLRLEVPVKPSLRRLRSTYSTAVASRIDRADNAKFLEQFRYTIVASQLLSGHSILGQPTAPPRTGDPSPANTTTDRAYPSPTPLVSVASAVAVAFLVSWVASGGYAAITRRRLLVVLILAAAMAAFAPVYFKRQWLKFRRDQALLQVTGFVGSSQDFDSATGAAIALVQEVELVSRGYRISAPLPPISRIEDRTQTRKCIRLRKALKRCFVDAIQQYLQASSVVKGFSEQLDLEKYYDIYDISDLDMSDALQGFTENEFEDLESLRTLKILAARLHTIRKMFLSALLALNATGDKDDLLRWTTAVEALRSLNECNALGYERLRTILTEEETFPSPATPKIPLTPGRERWRSQMRKLNSLSTGIRGLQAKLTLLREESDRALNESADISELGPTLMTQYDSIGVDLKDLIHAWEDGKAALALGIDRNEKRLSSMSITTLLSPTSSLSGLTTVEEGSGSGTALDALKALNGESPSSLDFGSPAHTDAEEVFEAVAIPRPRSMLTREERIVKMREERERKELVREKAEANRGMMRELEMVINLRPRAVTAASPARIASV